MKRILSLFILVSIVNDFTVFLNFIKSHLGLFNLPIIYLVFIDFCLDLNIMLHFLSFKDINKYNKTPGSFSMSGFLYSV